jgi:hypothetical protein
MAEAMASPLRSCNHGRGPGASVPSGRLSQHSEPVQAHRLHCAHMERSAKLPHALYGHSVHPQGEEMGCRQEKGPSPASPWRVHNSPRAGPIPPQVSTRSSNRRRWSHAIKPDSAHKQVPTPTRTLDLTNCVEPHGERMLCDPHQVRGCRLGY